MEEDWKPLNNILDQKTGKTLSQAGHRSRVKTAMDRDPDLSTFSDHEILESILFATNAQKDTKPIARDLINTFGSYSAVLRATRHELARVEGVGERTACLLSMILPAARRAEKSRMQSRVFLADPQSAASYLAHVFFGMTDERFFMVSIDTNDRAVQYDLINDGKVGEVEIDLKKMITIASRNGAAKILVAHNHPAGSLLPSQADIIVTGRIMVACELIGITFVDHLIFAGNEYFSFLGNHAMEAVYQNCDEALGTTNVHEFRQRKIAGLDDRYMKETEADWQRLSSAAQLNLLKSLLSRLTEAEKNPSESEENRLKNFVTGKVGIDEIEPE